MASRGGLLRAILRLSRPLWRSRRFSLWSEELFWSRWLGRHPDRVAELVDPSRPFDPELTRFIEHVQGERVQVLEVGAGPLSTVGFASAGRRIELTPTDILATRYARVLARRGITPPAPTIYADAERLVPQFGLDAFDLVFATNCVDHMERPLTAVAQMLSVVRPGGFVVLLHEVDEGAHQDYVGLHQWNLTTDGGRFVIWNQRERHDITSLLAGRCQVTAYVRDAILHTEIRKLHPGEIGLPAA
jgi:SAM-dependent methyltransferase